MRYRGCDASRSSKSARHQKRSLSNKKTEKEIKGRDTEPARRVHKCGQTTRTIPICQPLFPEINSRDVRRMQLPHSAPRCARMHFFAPSRVKRDREKVLHPSPEAAALPRARVIVGQEEDDRRTRDCDLFVRRRAFRNRMSALTVRTRDLYVSLTHVSFHTCDASENFHDSSSPAATSFLVDPVSRRRYPR